MSLPEAIKNALIVGDAKWAKEVARQKAKQEETVRRRNKDEEEAMVSAVEWCATSFPALVAEAAAHRNDSVQVPNKYCMAELRRKGITVRAYTVPESRDPDMRYNSYDEYYVDISTLRSML